MYSRLMKMDKDIPNQIINEIKRLLLPEEVQHENDIVLVRPTLALKEKALDYRKEHFQHGEEIIYGSELLTRQKATRNGYPL